LNFRTLPYTNVRFNYNTSHLFKTMGSTTPVVKPSPDSNSPMMMLPDPAVGIIDLATLKDIHRFLNQSGLQDDRELAAWVQQNFLYEPITPVGRELLPTGQSVPPGAITYQQDARQVALLQSRLERNAPSNCP
jgi:hypothetical protein